MKKFLLLLFIIHSGIIYSNIYYVANDGDDSNTGDIDNPLASIQKAQDLVSAGDTVYIRGGSYIIEESDISTVYQSLFACITFLDKSGVENNMINYWAYPGETPVFDFSAVKPADQRVVGIYVTGSYIHIKGLEMTGIQVTITTHTESYCIYSFGSHNIFENISMHDNVGTGLRHRKGGYNLFLNCDAYRNHDNVSEDQSGSNTDGFGCHPTAGGVGNVFRGCRAWFNSDDGFDCIRTCESIVFDSCWAFYNGYSPEFESLADGNGFKAGGYAYDTITKLPDPIPSLTLRYCLAVGNKANGFYSNHHLAGNYWYNNSAYRNNINYNMVNRESPESDDINVDGYGHVLKNNLSYGGRTKETDYINEEACTLENNSFTLSLSLSDSDFESIDESWLTYERDENGKLPQIDFLKPVENSSLIDAGVDIGYTFYGSAPDIGAFELYSDSADTLSSVIINKESRLSIYPNPVSKRLNIDSDSELNTIEILKLSGQLLMSEYNANSIDASTLEKGIYLLRYETNSQEVVFAKFVKL